MKFIVTTNLGRSFLSVDYNNIRHIQDNAFQYEGGVFCENNTFVASNVITIIEPLIAQENKTESK